MNSLERGLCGLLLLIIAGVMIARTSSAASQRTKLRKHDRVRLVEARAQGNREVTLLIASSPGANQRVLHHVARAGGRVQYRDDDVSYLRVKVPIDAVESIAQSPDVDALNIDGSVVYVSQAPVENGNGHAPANRIAPPDAKTPAENPYLPSREIGAPQFISAHPTFDGRGAVVALIDNNIDLLVPELQTAKTIDGKSTRKILDIRSAAASAIDPSEDRGRLSSYINVDMREEVRAEGGVLVHKDLRYAVPAEGVYRIGVIDERMNGNARGDLNLDGNPAGSNGLFTVLWNERAGTVWVDTNQNNSFTDEKVLRDYAAGGDTGLFGKDSKTIGFAVQTDPAHQAVFIFPGMSFHGTIVSGAAFGKGFFGGSLNGVAPEAQIVSIPFLGVAHSLIESLIVAVKHPQVDVVSLQVVYYIPMNDGDSTFANVSDRLIEKYKKPIFSSAGNGAEAINGVHEGAASKRSLTVGSYINAETSRVNYGVTTPRRDNIDVVSGRGPSETGAIKPDILAPTMSLTTSPRFLPSETYNNTYTLPAGYSVTGGTSTATPIAAAGAALLVSAAKQTGIPYDAERLRWAITSSARYLPEYAVYDQGAGVFNVGAAWQALKDAKSHVAIESRAPVNTVLSKSFKKPDAGSGIYEREGWKVGQEGKRTITFTRTTGGKTPVTYSLRWQGNDGTFSSPTTVALPLGQSVSVTITIKAKTPGVHSAVLNLDEIDGLKAVHRVQATIIAAEEFTNANNFTITQTATLEWMQGRSYFFYVPPNTPSLNVQMTIAAGNARLLLMRPSGDSHYELTTYATNPCAYQTGGSCGQTVVKPEAGVWQVVVENKNTRGDSRFASPNHVTFRMTAEISRNTDIRKDAGVDFSSSFTLNNAHPWIYDLDIKPGTRNLLSAIDNVSQPGADLDLYLFDCSTGECVLKDFSQRDDSDERVEVQQPTAGKWKLVVDPVHARDRINGAITVKISDQRVGGASTSNPRDVHTRCTLLFLRDVDCAFEFGPIEDWSFLISRHRGLLN
ncbi:MAG TPA: S8 family serine peptidase [Pyrinomonadaceae bacterium]|nr:S8 family serine peptidase [Pyrinomonadaceae bacterium]